MATKISWTDEVWNPVTGCTKVSAGCKNCYAERIAKRLWKDEIATGNVVTIYEPDGQPLTGEEYRKREFSDVRCHPERLEIPLHWKKPRRIFVNSMSDLFHEAVSDEFIKDIWSIMYQTPQHSYQILTKRPSRMLEHFTRRWMADETDILPNVILMVSAENQPTADERIPLLLQTPAAKRGVSLEPLLGPIDLIQSLKDAGIDWVIVGGESGPGHRPMKIEWLESIVRQCRAANVPVFVKQDIGPRPGMQGRIPDYLWELKEYPQ